MKNMTFSGNENIDYSQSTKKTFSSKKIFLLIMAALAAASDLALLVVFAIAGHGGLAIPIVLLIFDALFITGVCLSNFRFKYAVGIWVTYIIVSVIATSILAVLDAGEVYMTYTAKYLNVFAHLALYLALIFASIYPLLKSNNKLRFVMSLTVIVAIVLMGAFATYFSINGYFGQGFVGGQRVVGYALDEESDTYIATSIKNGRGDTVIIPEEFNGKKVSGVNCSIFTDTTISTVDIQSQEEIEFVDTYLLAYINDELKVGVDKKYIDKYRQMLIDQKDYEYDTSYLKLSNSLYPIHLQENERYVTFSYQEYPTQSKIVPTWIGKAGEKFDLSYASDMGYMAHADASNNEHLQWCCDNNSRKILAGGIVDFIGNKVDGNKSGVSVEFDTIYKIKIDKDNDEVYEPADSYKTTTIGNKVYDYHLVTLKSADDMLGNLSSQLLAERDGFDLSWKQVNTFSSVALTSLRNNLESYNSETMTIAPVWRLKDPTELKLTFDKSGYVYGDDVNIKATAVAPNEYCQLQYNWVYSVGTGDPQTTINATGEYSITNAFPQDGVIIVLVTASAPDKTSLTSNEQVKSNIKVDKRPLNITWREPSDMVYDAQAKMLQYSVGEGELINGETLENNVYLENITNINAGSYTAKIDLKYTISDRYSIVSGEEHNYTIAKRPTDAVWTSDDYTYDGYSHNAMASAKDIYGNDLPLTLSNAQKNAGTYTATVASADNNYAISNSTYEFTIKQKSVTVNWSTSVITYSGVAQYPSVSGVNGLVGYENINNELIYSGYSSNINAGDGYTVKVELPSSSNYKFDSEQTTEYNIHKRGLRIRAIANDKTYDGKANTFDFEVVSGLASVHTKNSLGTPTFSGTGVGAIDVGNYSVSVSLPSNGVTDNYDITYSNANFVINKAQIALSWSNYTVQDGKIIPPSVNNTNLPSDIVLGNYVYKDVLGRTISSIPYENGTYYVEVSPQNSNYTFTNTSFRFTVSSIGNEQQREVA